MAEDIEAVMVEGKETPPVEVVKPEVDVAALTAENIAMKAHMGRLTKDVESSRGYVQQMVDNLRKQSAAQDDNDEPDLNAAFNEDPARAAEHLINLKMAPLQQATMFNQAGLNRQLTEQRILQDEFYAPYWKKYSGEVDEFMRRVPLDLQAQPTSWENAFTFVMASKLRDIYADMKSNNIEQQKKAFVEGKGLGSPTAKQGTELDPAEVKVASMMGLSAEEYAKWRNVA